MNPPHDRDLNDRVLSVLRDAVRDSEAGRIDLIEFLDGLSDCIAWVSSDLHIRYMNRAFAKWYGIPREDIIGRSVEEMTDAAFETLHPYIVRALAGERVRFEMTLSLRGAPARDIIVTYLPRVGSDGERDGYFTLVEDVTDEA